MIHYMINAWLDRRQPKLELIEKNSGNIIGRWQGRGLQQLFNSGLISYEELASNDRTDSKQLVKALILELTCEELCGRCLYER
ncbi:hypothetical protein [Kangiella sediminilitoris]|uniref:Uncharacterized protein n=1 Tax=Kangiella sediminilitoris TaxID=1144748 RepID=A0A1B3B9S1_9GAMM|nr:hypothetical protein [Kangiella sediminilitoris]AOE49486.1 hypothetical protein KS2013_762 [Kangiella sediminilitoris]